jgi:hypothetical protein
LLARLNPPTGSGVEGLMVRELACGDGDGRAAAFAGEGPCAGIGFAEAGDAGGVVVIGTVAAEGHDDAGGGA